MKLYNTLSRQVEEFVPVEEDRVRYYVCGPTVYDHTHIGHMRTYINNDLLRRSLEYLGYQVNHVMNITDVGHLRGDRDMGEDKLEKAAKEKKLTAWDLARQYEAEFFEVMDSLLVKRPHQVCRATEYIQEMADFVQALEEKGLTYKTSDGVYFDTSKMADYNGLSKLPLTELKEGARVEVNKEKKNPTDFALWKFAKAEDQRQMEWETVWGKHTFPGWHIECSAMSMKHLGDKIDIHAGGVDHIHVHHTNERAQNWALTGDKVVNWWFHNEHLLIEGEKMSKSLKNFLTLADLREKGFMPLVVRYLFLTAHYRKRMNFTWESLEAARTALARLHGFWLGWPEPNEGPGCDLYRAHFKAKLEDDLNLPEALAVVWSMVKSQLAPASKKFLLAEFDQVLGLGFIKVVQDEIPPEVASLIKDRDTARKNKEWESSDELREKISDLGYEVEDTPEGTKVKKR